MFGVFGKLFLLLVAALVAFSVFQHGRADASRSRARRTFVLVRGGGAVIVGLGLAFGLAPRAVGNPESPAGLGAVLLLWVVGGGLAFLGAASLAGAAFARPASAKGGDSGA